MLMIAPIRSRPIQWISGGCRRNSNGTRGNTEAGSTGQKKGHIKEEGWARHPIWRYDRSSVKGGRLRIKEWDYYAVINTEKRYAVTATISDLGYAALFAISYIDYDRKAVSQSDALHFFPLGKIGLSASSTEDNQVAWSNTKIRLAFIKKGTKRHLMVACPSLVLPDGSVGLDFDIILTQEAEAESLNIATSWREQRKAFLSQRKGQLFACKGKKNSQRDGK